MERECLELLVLQLHTLYYLGDLRSFPTLAAAIVERSHRLGDQAALPFVAEMTALAYLERGLVNQALAAARPLEGEDADAPGRLAEALTLQLVRVTIFQALQAWSESAALLAQIPARLERLSADTNRSRSFYQMFVLHRIEQTRSQAGAAAALREISRYVDEKVFQGVLLDEACVKSLEIAVEARQAGAAKRFQALCETREEKLEPSQRLRLLLALSRAALERTLPAEAAGDWLRRAAALLNVVQSPLLVAEFHDLKAHALLDLGRYDEAFNRWKAAERDYARYTHTWSAAQRRDFERGARAWQAHLKLQPLIECRLE
jgi:hypothetical protein